MKNKVLVLDDERNIRDIFTLLLQENNYLVETAASGSEALEKAKTFAPDVLLLDMNLPDMAGMEVLSRIQRYLPKCRILIITAFGTIRNAVEATKLGAYAYLEKPVDNDELLLMISRALEVKKLEAEVEDLKTELTSRYSFANIVGTSAKMNSVFQMMHRIARVDGGKRNGQGARRPRHPFQRPPEGRPVRRSELRGDPARPDRIRVLRTQQRGIHGCQVGKNREVRARP
jgi:DNA-binding NtrC family response regulator